LNVSAHPWKGSGDPAELATCAKLLCQPKNGVIPSMENVQEAFEAIDKLLTLHGGRGNNFFVRAYFILALYCTWGRNKKRSRF
jgi:hypothetical protein